MTKQLLPIREGTLFQRMLRAHVKQTTYGRDSGWDYLGYAIILVALGVLLGMFGDLV